MEEGMDLGRGGLFEEPTDPLLSTPCPPPPTTTTRLCLFSLFLCRMSPGSINGGEPVIWLQTALPLPGAEDYILMISAHLDTVGFFFFLHLLGLCVETMRPFGKLVLQNAWNAIFALAFVPPWTSYLIKT